MTGFQNAVTVSRRPPDVQDYIDMLRRHRGWLIGPIFAGLVTAVVAAFLWPDTYVSSAVLRITPQQLAPSLAPIVINMQMAARLQQMQQQILSRSSLGELIQRPSLDLYRKQRARYPTDDVIRDFAKAIRIQMIDTAAPGQGRTASAFTIQFSYPDRFKAQAVVRELVSRFMEENSAVLRRQTGMMDEFFGETLKADRAKMDALEARISEFRSQHMGRLPEQLMSSLAHLQSLEAQLGNANEALSRMQQVRMQLETQLQNAARQMNYYRSMAEEQVAVGGGTQTVRNKLDILNQRMIEFQTLLAAAREMYTPNHPQIRKLEVSLKSLEGEFEKAQKEDIDKQAAAARDTPRVERRVNPAAVKMAQDFEDTIHTVKTEIETTGIAMKEKTGQVQALNAAIANVNARIESGPGIERQYAALMRDHAMAKQTYEEDHRKQEMTQTAKSIEGIKAGENLEIVDQASDPITPAEPDRLQIAAMGTGIGLLAGVVLAGAREVKNTSLKNLKDVRAYTNLPVLSSIPLLENALSMRRSRRIHWLAWSSAMVIGSIAMGGSAYYYYFSAG